VVGVEGYLYPNLTQKCSIIFDTKHRQTTRSEVAGGSCGDLGTDTGSVSYQICDSHHAFVEHEATVIDEWVGMHTEIRAKAQASEVFEVRMMLSPLTRVLESTARNRPRLGIGGAPVQNCRAPRRIDPVSPCHGSDFRRIGAQSAG
jgi:hypothetical protein